MLEIVLKSTETVLDDLLRHDTGRDVLSAFIVGPSRYLCAKTYDVILGSMTSPRYTNQHKCTKLPGNTGGNLVHAQICVSSTVVEDLGSPPFLFQIMGLGLGFLLPHHH